MYNKNNADLAWRTIEDGLVTAPDNRELLQLKVQVTILVRARLAYIEAPYSLPQSTV